MDERESLEQQYEELCATPISDMTLKELREGLRKMQHLEYQLSGQKITQSNRQEVPRRRRRYEGGAPRPSTQEQRPIRERNISEQHVGRYVMTILAATLCLLALGVFITSFWAYMSDATRFLLLLVLCVVLEALGFWRESKGSMRPFWLGIAGLGTSGLLLVIISGTMVWYLYDTLLTGLMAIVWFVATFLLAYNRKVGVFYVIAYIGGAITTALACLSIAPGLASEIVLIFLIGAVVGVGYGGYKITGYYWLLIANQIFCWFAVCSVGDAYKGMVTDVYPTDILGEYNPVVISWFLVLVLGFCLFNTRYLSEKPTYGALFINSVVSYFNCGFFLLACEFAGGKELGYGLACVGIILAMLYSTPGYLIGASVPLMVATASISEGMTDHFNVGDMIYTCGALLPAIILLAFCAIPAALRKQHDRVGVVVFSVCTFAEALSSYYKVSPHFYVAVAFLLFLAWIAYVFNVWRNDWFFSKPVDLLLLSVVPSIVLAVLCRVNLLPDVTPFVVVTASLQVYGVFYLNQQEDSKRTGAYVVWCVLRVLAYIVILGNCLFPDTPTKVLLTLSLMLTVVYNLYQMIDARSRVQTVICCIMANLHLWMISGMWGWDIQLLISMVGLLIGVGFIVGGFYISLKPARQCGLACCIIYVLKMGLIDSSGGGLGTAGGLLVAGLVCFAISFAYNKALKLYEGEDRAE